MWVIRGSISNTLIDILIARFRIIVLRNLRLVVILFSLVTVKMYMIELAIDMSMMIY